MKLIDGGLIVVYEVDGKQYAEIPSFKTHQIINNRDLTARVPRVNHACKRVKAEGRKEGKGKERKEMASSRNATHANRRFHPVG